MGFLRISPNYTKTYYENVTIKCSKEHREGAEWGKASLSIVNPVNI